MVSKLCTNSFSASGVGDLNLKALKGPTFGKARIRKDNSFAENPGRLYPLPYCLSYCFWRILYLKWVLVAPLFFVSMVFFLADQAAFVITGNMLATTHLNVSTAKLK